MISRERSQCVFELSYVHVFPVFFFVMYFLFHLNWLESERNYQKKTEFAKAGTMSNAVSFIGSLSNKLLNETASTETGLYNKFDGYCSQRTGAFLTSWNWVVNPATEWISYSLNSTFLFCYFVFRQISFFLCVCVISDSGQCSTLICTFFSVVFFSPLYIKMTMSRLPYMICFQLHIY